MKLTAPAPALTENSSTERELFELVNQLRVAVNQRYEATYFLTTAATGALSTIWTSDDLPINSVAEVTCFVVGRATAGAAARATYRITACVYRDAGGVATFQGVPLTEISFESVALFDCQLVVAGSAVVLKVSDDGVRTMLWRALVTMRVV